MDGHKIWNCVKQVWEWPDYEGFEVNPDRGSTHARFLIKHLEPVTEEPVAELELA